MTLCLTQDALQLILSQPVKETSEEITSVAKLVVDNYEEEEIKSQFLNLSLQLWVHSGSIIPSLN